MVEDLVECRIAGSNDDDNVVGVSSVKRNKGQMGPILKKLWNLIRMGGDVEGIDYEGAFNPTIKILFYTR